VKVFISWSGEHSHAVALVLRDWLQAVLHHVEPLVSSEDIQKGALWGPAIATELDATTFAILCIVPGNVAEPWLVFEAAIWRGLGSTRVAPFLVGVERKDVRGPLSLFQSTVFDKDDVRKLFHSVNKSSASPVDGGKVDRTFDACWSTFAAMWRRRPDGPRRWRLQSRRRGR
jgi:TIR domain